jgi:hypothetical protein
MKALRLIFIFTILVWACDDDSSPNSNQGKIENIAKEGTWRITYFYDTDKEETTNYTGYNFTFGASSVLTATNGTNTYTGIWSITDSNSNDDSMDDLHYNIAFTAPPAFEELSDDWDIIEITATKIKLIDISGGNGGTDYLTFEKN